MATSVYRRSVTCFLTGLIHIAPVPPGNFQLPDIFRRRRRSPAADALDQLVQSGIHVLRHAIGVAADINRCALFEPVKYIPGMLEEAVLNVNLFFVVA